jgi:hypothetical protein
MSKTVKFISVNHRHRCTDEEQHVFIISHNSGDVGDPALSILILILIHGEFL